MMKVGKYVSASDRPIETMCGAMISFLESLRECILKK